MRNFGGERIQTVMSKFSGSEDEPIEAKALTKIIENSQRKVEGRNFTSRKYVLQYDNVMNKQREIIYNERRRVIEGEDLKNHVLNMANEFVDEYIESCVADSKYSEEWDLANLEKQIKGICSAFELGIDTGAQISEEELRDIVHDKIRALYDEKEEEIGEERMRELERMILIRVVDNKWMDHIDAMDQLRTGIGLRGIGQQDPAMAYANEGFDMFEEMISNIKEDTVKFAFNVTVQTDSQRKQVIGTGSEQKADAESAYDRGRQDTRLQRQIPGAAPKASVSKQMTVKRNHPKIGRNELCPCGSGKKYKNCHGRPGCDIPLDQPINNVK